MKRLSLTLLSVLILATAALAAEMNVADVLSDAPKYVDRTVTVKGKFLYSEPFRQSFTIMYDNVRLEVFYRDLPANDKLFVTSQANNSRKEIVVAGALRQYANKERSYFMEATSLEHEGSAATAAPGVPNTVSFVDLLSDTGKYLNKPITMTGTFLYSEPARQSFTFEQNGKTMEVLLSDLSKIDRDRILDLKMNSKVGVVVTGVVQNYANDKKRFFMTAYSVTLQN